MNDVEAFAQLTKMMISTIEGLAQMGPRWRDTLGSLADLTPVIGACTDATLPAPFGELDPDR